MKEHEEPRNKVCGNLGTTRNFTLLTQHSMRAGIVTTLRDGNDRLRKGKLHRRDIGDPVAENKIVCFLSVVLICRRPSPIIADIGFRIIINAEVTILPESCEHRM